MTVPNPRDYPPTLTFKLIETVQNSTSTLQILTLPPIWKSWQNPWLQSIPNQYA